MNAIIPESRMVRIVPSVSISRVDKRRRTTQSANRPTLDQICVYLALLPIPLDLYGFLWHRRNVADANNRNITDHSRVRREQPDNKRIVAYSNAISIGNRLRV